jgi:GH15 family glucan-1,4-alpha-glucosidase
MALAYSILDAINKANAIADFSFYENFNTQNGTPNGVAYCAWSAAATILLHNSLNNNFKLFYKI